MGILLDGFWMRHHDIGVAAKKMWFYWRLPKCGIVHGKLFIVKISYEEMGTI